MQVLVCGAGRIATQLLQQLGESWDVVLVDMNQERLQKATARFSSVRQTVSGDASSPVVLDEAGVGEADYVLALTGSDAVNLAIIDHAQKRGLRAILALAHEQVEVQAFRERRVRFILPGRLLAQHAYHFLQDPRITIHTLDMVEAEVVEIDAADHFALVGRPVSTLAHAGWQLVGLYRDGELLFPEADMRVGKSDRLVILGQRDVFNTVCSLMECGLPHFPLTYGQTLVVQIPTDGSQAAVLSEALHLAQHTRVQSVRMLVAQGAAPEASMLQDWPQTRTPVVQSMGEEDELAVLRSTVRTYNTGLVLRPPLRPSWLDLFKRAPHVNLAHNLGCPMFLARNPQAQYKRIVVTFNGSTAGMAGLEVGVDVARQTRLPLAAVVVQESDVIQGAGGEKWLEETLHSLREMAHVHKVPIEEIVGEGNPVRETLAAVRATDMIIIGCERSQKGLFVPNVPELLVRRLPGSVVLVPA
ncbi:MAG: NAD-binding protein [Thermodesulfobacteriota bacterium]